MLQCVEIISKSCQVSKGECFSIAQLLSVAALRGKAFPMQALHLRSSRGGGEGFQSRGVRTLLLLQEVSWSPNTTKSQYNKPHAEVYWKREKRYRKVAAEGSAVEQNAGFIQGFLGRQAGRQGLWSFPGWLGISGILCTDLWQTQGLVGLCGLIFGQSQGLVSFFFLPLVLGLGQVGIRMFFLGLFKTLQQHILSCINLEKRQLEDQPVF